MGHCRQLEAKGQTHCVLAFFVHSVTVTATVDTLQEVENPQRLGVLVEVPRLLEELGVAAAPFLKAHGLTRADFRDQEQSLPSTVLLNVLEDAAKATDRPDFGLLLGRLARPGHLGLVGQLMAHAASLQEAMIDLTENHYRHARGSVPYLIESEEDAVFGHRVLVGAPATPQAGLTAVSVSYHVLTALSPARPHTLLFACRPPPGIRRDQFNGTRLEFEATQFALVYRRKDLAAPITTAHQERRVATRSAMDVYERYLAPDIVDMTRRAVLRQLLQNDLSVITVAKSLNISRRTLSRQLQLRETSPRAIISEVRYAIAVQLISATDLSMTTIAASLGYEELSSFTRWFRSHDGSSPSRWRTATLPP